MSNVMDLVMVILGIYMVPISDIWDRFEVNLLARANRSRSSISTILLCETQFRLSVKVSTTSLVSEGHVGTP